MKTQAAVLYRLNTPLVIEELEIPALRRGQVLVKLLYSGVCRTQLNEINGQKGRDQFLPHLIGHEASGIVLDRGDGVSKVKKNDSVIVSWIKGSGLEGGPVRYKKGSRVINSGSVATWSRYAVISENRLTKIPKEMPADIMSIVGCAVATGAGIIKNTLAVKPGTTVVVFGVGGIGASAVLEASSRKCKKIIAVDISEEKMKFARELGATNTLLFQKEHIVEKIHQMTDSGVDYVVEATGNIQAMEASFEVLKNGGCAVLAGNIKKGQSIRIDPYGLINGKRILGSFGGDTNPDRDFPYYIRAFKEGRLKINSLITKTYTLSEVHAAITAMRDNTIVGRAVINLQL